MGIGLKKLSSKKDIKVTPEQAEGIKRFFRWFAETHPQPLSLEDFEKAGKKESPVDSIVDWIEKVI